MRITKETIEHIANLARLNISEKEKGKLITEMQTVVSYFDKLGELDTTGIEPTRYLLDIKNVFRTDEADKSFDRERILANAPSQGNGCFKVPKVVE